MHRPTRAACLISCSVLLPIICGCAAPAVDAPAAPPVSYMDEVSYLRARTDIVELQSGSMRVAVAPRLQGRVMTSSFSPAGLSLGWVNRAAVEAGEEPVAFNNYGGQDVLWLGPEGGPFSLFHPGGEDQTYDNWTAPAALNRGAFVVMESEAQRVHLRRRVDLTNALGTEFRLRVERTIELLPRERVVELLSAQIPPGVTCVGFSSENRLTNIGEEPLRADDGTVGIRSIGVFRAHDGTVVMLPFRQAFGGPRVNTSYVPAQPGNRTFVDLHTGVLLFRADGLCRSKAGMGPEWARDRIASIDFANRVLTIVLYDRPEGLAPYVNNVMDVQQEDPLAGDVVSASSSDGGDGLGYYELESSSPAAFLAPGESMTHTHRTLQFQGPIGGLSELCRATIGIEFERVRWFMR